MNTNDNGRPSRRTRRLAALKAASKAIAELNGLYFMSNEPGDDLTPETARRMGMALVEILAMIDVQIILLDE